MARIRQWAKAVVFHPLVFATFPVLSLYIRNMGKGFFREAMVITVTIAVCAVLVWLLVFLFVRDNNKAAIIVSALFVLFFSYGPAISVVTTVFERTNLLGGARFLVQGTTADLVWLIIWGVLFGAATLFSVRRKSDLKLATQSLNFVALALVVMLAVNFSSAGGFGFLTLARLGDIFENVREVVARIGSARSDTSRYHGFLPVAMRGKAVDPYLGRYGSLWLGDSTLAKPTAGTLPDIYYIILDSYIRADHLKEEYDYDIAEFLSYLTDKGFFVASASRSNYPYTTHSLASSLNFMYLGGIAEQVGPITSHGPSVAMINNSRLVDFLRGHGYKFVTFATGFWFTEIRNADIYMEPLSSGWRPSEFQQGLVNLTPLSVVPILRRTQDDIARERVLYALDHLVDGTKSDGPTFVFAHISSPHDPYVFGPHGEPVESQRGYTYEEYVNAYRNQVAFLNEKMPHIIQDILSRSPEPPLIIIQADHGATYGSYGEHLAERMSILNAYYFPDQNYADLYDGITPVNTFRVVLNNYFGADYPLLDDRSYYAPPESPYVFTDVTDQVIDGN